jgi:hypothetical protein
MYLQLLTNVTKYSYVHSCFRITWRFYFLPTSLCMFVCMCECMHEHKCECTYLRIYCICTYVNVRIYEYIVYVHI